MKRFRWRRSLLIFALALSLSFSLAHAGKNIYLYDPSVVGEIDLNAYLLNGTVKKPTGGSFAHYVQKDKIMESAVTGAPVIALCGKVWIPNRDPQKFPVCPECQEIYDSLPESGGKGGKGSDND